MLLREARQVGNRAGSVGEFEVGVGVHGQTNIAMSHEFLCHARRDTVAGQQRGEGVAQAVNIHCSTIVAAPGELSAGQYQQARTIQEQRRVDAMEDKTAPQKRLLLNQAREEIIVEIGGFYLPNEVVEPDRRIAAYTAQFLTSYRITNSIQANKSQAKLAQIMLADLDTPTSKSAYVDRALTKAA